MKLQVLAAAVVLALASSNIEAQTLGDSVVAGNDSGANMTTDTEADNAIMNKTDKHPVGHAGLNDSKAHTNSSGLGSDDSYVTTVHQNDSMPANADHKKPDGSRGEAGPSKQTSGASSTLLTAGISLLAVAIAATL